MRQHPPTLTVYKELSAARKAKAGTLNWNIRPPCSPLKAAKIGLSNKGKSASAATRQKMSETRKGKPKSLAHIAAIKASKERKKLSEFLEQPKVKGRVELQLVTAVPT